MVVGQVEQSEKGGGYASSCKSKRETGEGLDVVVVHASTFLFCGRLGQVDESGSGRLGVKFHDSGVLFMGRFGDTTDGVRQTWCCRSYFFSRSRIRYCGIRFATRFQAVG